MPPEVTIFWVSFLLSCWNYAWDRGPKELEKVFFRQCIDMSLLGHGESPVSLGDYLCRILSLFLASLAPLVSLKTCVKAQLSLGAQQPCIFLWLPCFLHLKLVVLVLLQSPGNKLCLFPHPASFFLVPSTASSLHTLGLCAPGFVGSS